MIFIAPSIAMALVLTYLLKEVRLSTENIPILPWIGICTIIQIPNGMSEAIGHETIYTNIFYGASWENGSTLAYPAMQIWSLVWGFLCAHQEWGLFFTAICTTSTSAIVFLSCLMSVGISKTRAYWGCALFLIHPDISSWIGHHHNIIPPLLFALIAQWILLKSNRFSLYASALSLSIAIMMRLEFVLLLPFFLAQVSYREWWKPLVIGFLFCGAGILPLLSEAPGKGERMLSLIINLPMLSFWSPSLWMLFLLVLFSHNKKNLWVLGYCLVVHALCSTFNDYGPRHLIALVPILIWACAQSKHIYTLVIFSGLLLWGRWEREIIYEADDAAFLRYINTEFGDIPHRSLADVRRQTCAWIVEEAPFAEEQIRSHFNLYDPAEEQALRNKYGCIHWCRTKEDWRWTSLSVAPRSQRILSLYQTKPIAIVTEKQSSCIVYDLIKRNR